MKIGHITVRNFDLALSERDLCVNIEGETAAIAAGPFLQKGTVAQGVGFKTLRHYEIFS